MHGWLSEFTWRRLVRRPLTATLAASRGPCPEPLHWNQLLPLGTGSLGMDQRVSGRVDREGELLHAPYSLRHGSLISNDLSMLFCMSI